MLINANFSFIYYLAKADITLGPYSKQVASQLNLSLSSISRAMATLIERDYVYQDKQGRAKLLDPLMKSVLLLP